MTLRPALDPASASLSAKSEAPDPFDEFGDLPGRDRKAEHIEIALDPAVQTGDRFFDRWYFEHNALPNLDMASIDTSVEFLGKRIAAPILISCMTGGTGSANEINRNLALAAEQESIAVGVGSQRKAIEDSAQTESFKIRELAPSVPLLANLGAVQLNYGFGLAECRQAVEMIDADALVFHLNPLQEAIQPEGQTDFSGLLGKMQAIAAELSVPIIVKEVGNGLSATVGRLLADAGITLLDTAGLGGTSWARIEARRADDVELGERFADWGIPTPESIQQLASIPGVSVIGSGGLRSGVDVAKAIALGADLAGLAYPFLEPATRSADAVAAKIQRVIAELKIVMFSVGARTVEDLQSVPLTKRSEP